jgi:hypothetical protein
MMPLGLFRSPVFSGANAITFLLYFALGGILFFLPFNLIRIQGYSATLAGAAFEGGNGVDEARCSAA